MSTAPVSWRPDGDGLPVARQANSASHGDRQSISLHTPWALAVALTSAAIAMLVLHSGRVTTVKELVALSFLGGGAAAGVLVALRARRGGLFAGLAMLALAATTVVSAAASANRANAGPTGAGQDGGVLATQGATSALLHGQDPYAISLADRLGSPYQKVLAIGHNGRRIVVANPLRHYYPYLPAAFLLNVPGQALVGSNGWFDPRWLYLLAVFLAAGLIATWPAQDWARGAALLGFVNAALILWCAYGSNDAAVASWIVVAALCALRWPRLAGIALALAVSYKFILVVAAVPIGIVVYRHGGWRQLRRCWTFPATLAATIVPFLLWSPRGFIKGALLFQLGLVPDKFPTSGMGLPVLLPGVFHGGVSKLGVLMFGAIGVALAAKLAWRWPRPEIVAPATAVAIFGVLVCADTFQTNYLVMLLSLAGAGWLLASSAPSMAEPLPAPAVAT